MKKIVLCFIYIFIALFGYTYNCFSFNNSRAVFTASENKSIIENFIIIPLDLTASTKPRLDNNGEACALIKVRYAAKGVSFEGNIVGSCENKKGEYYVYMTSGSKRLVVKSLDFYPLDIDISAYFPKGLDGKKTYLLTIVGEKEKRQNLLIDYSPNFATVLVDNQLVNGTKGNVKLLLPVGAHEFIIAADGYYSENGTINLKEQAPSKLNIELVRKDNVIVKDRKSETIDYAVENYKEIQSTQNMPIDSVLFRKLIYKEKIDIPNLSRYEDMGICFSGYNRVKVCKDGKWGFVDANGYEVIPCIYDDVSDVFSEGLMWAVLDGKVGYIDEEGKTVIPFVYINKYNVDNEADIRFKNNFSDLYYKDFHSGLACVTIMNEGTYENILINQNDLIVTQYNQHYWGMFYFGEPYWNAYHKSNQNKAVMVDMQGNEYEYTFSSKKKKKTCRNIIDILHSVAEQDNTMGQYRYGLYCYNTTLKSKGNSVSKFDVECFLESQACQYIKKSADKGYRPAEYLLAELYYKRGNYNIAMEWLEKYLNHKKIIRE